MIQELFSALSLDPKEREVYLKLLQFGPQRASIIAYQLGLPRTTVQHILVRLEQLEVVAKTIEKNVFVFAAIHPEELVAVLELKKRRQAAQMDKTIEQLKRITPELTSMMQTTKKIPGVKFFHGREGVHNVLFDTLTSKTPLKDFANIDAMFEYVEDINNEYVKAREETTITKRSLILDTPFAHKVYESGAYSPKSHKGYKWINAQLYPFSLEMNIYDGRVSYITYVENDFVGVIIKNDYIYEMHDSMWNLIWDILPSPF
ncbi:hypothetical protein KBD59_01390 [Candidatus Gracilibacteria bacterium]|nr:hypothetical protein [Candidatus Gracilibacteria bacterium]